MSCILPSHGDATPLRGGEWDPPHTRTPREGQDRTFLLRYGRSSRLETGALVGSRRSFILFLALRREPGHQRWADWPAPLGIRVLSHRRGHAVPVGLRRGSASGPSGVSRPAHGVHRPEATVLGSSREPGARLAWSPHLPPAFSRTSPWSRITNVFFALSFMCQFVTSVEQMTGLLAICVRENRPHGAWPLNVCDV